LWPSWFVAVIAVAVMVNFVAVMVIVCGRRCCGRHGHRLWPSWFVAVMVMKYGIRCNRLTPAVFGSDSRRG